MRRFMLFMVVLGIGAQVSAAEISQTDRQQMFQLAQQMDHAWTVGDAEANAQLFAIDATARFGDDPLGQGREAIRQQFEGFFKSRPAGLRHVTKVERIEGVADGLVMWDAEVRVERRLADGNWSTLTRIRNVSLVVRQPDGWRIRAVRAFPVSQ